MSTRFASATAASFLAGFLIWAVQVAPAKAADFEVLDDPAQVDELAGVVQRTGKSLCWELHRFHRDKPDFNEAYKQAREVWGMSGMLRDALRAGNVDPATLNDQVLRMNDALTRFEKGTANWGDGVRPGISTPDEPKTVVVAPSPVNVEVPLLFGGSISVGGGSRMVVADPAPSNLPRKRFHPNAHGSRRALDRELATVRFAMNNLLEDTGAVPTAGAVPSDSAAPAGAKPTPTPPAPNPPDASTGPVLKISPPSAKKTEPVKK